uniref:BTB domain-containing protein n=1 Tax=Trichuris muris TaxID=70415 RepID=A0A5S6Q0U3_TRIMR
MEDVRVEESPPSTVGLQDMMALQRLDASGLDVVRVSSGGCEGKPLTIAGSPSQYVKLNVGGYLYYTTVGTLIKQDSMLRAMFSGRMEVLTDPDGWVLIDRCGKHFDVILRFLRDGHVALPNCATFVQHIMAEAKYYCMQVVYCA